jgi:hypothetical protein
VNRKRKLSALLRYDATTSASLRSNKSLDGVILDGPPSMDGSTTVVIIGGSIV